jgi:hypothetical protein
MPGTEATGLVLERTRNSCCWFVNYNDSVVFLVLVQKTHRSEVHPCQSTAMAGDRRHRARFAIVAAGRVDTTQNTCESDCHDDDCESVCDTAERFVRNSERTTPSTAAGPTLLSASKVFQKPDCETHLVNLVCGAILALARQPTRQLRAGSPPHGKGKL